MFQASDFDYTIMDSMTSLDMRWAVRVSKPGGGEIFRTYPDRPWGTPTLKYKGHWVIPGLTV